jgi:hypothetical protein
VFFINNSKEYFKVLKRVTKAATAVNHRSLVAILGFTGAPGRPGRFVCQFVRDERKSAAIVLNAKPSIASPE